ncbi:MAG: hypothetical protein K2K63_02800 [Acetatifactor sp.]|nr:hypothetical protein [Acetatifactor sp.]
MQKGYNNIMKIYLKIIIASSIIVFCIAIIMFLIGRKFDIGEEKGFENIENFNSLSLDRQKQILNLIGEWELVEWSVQWRGYGYNQDWCEQDDFYIGRKVEIRPDGTAIYMDENYQVEQDEILVMGIDIALGSGYIAGDAERLGEQIILAFSSATNKGRFWIHIGEDGQVYYRDLMTGGLYSMQNRMGE